MLKKSNIGFTLVELMVVVAIIAVVLAVAVPNLFKSTEKSRQVVCVSNLKNIDSAAQLYAAENSIISGSMLSGDQEDVMYSAYLKNGKPKCPGGGEYTLNPLGSDPQVTCSLEDQGHALS